MTRRFLFAKIHRATVTQVELHYTGSITIDANLLDDSPSPKRRSGTSSAATCSSQK